MFKRSVGNIVIGTEQASCTMLPALKNMVEFAEILIAKILRKYVCMYPSYECLYLYVYIVHVLLFIATRQSL